MPQNKLENLKITNKKHFEVKGENPFTGYSLTAIEFGDEKIVNTFELLISKTAYNTLLVGDVITISEFIINKKPSFTTKTGIIVDNHFEVKRIKNISVVERFAETIIFN